MYKRNENPIFIGPITKSSIHQNENSWKLTKSGPKRDRCESSNKSYVFLNDFVSLVINYLFACTYLHIVDLHNAIRRVFFCYKDIRRKAFFTMATLLMLLLENGHLYYLIVMSQIRLEELSLHKMKIAFMQSAKMA